jgi:hypothetical protein
LDFLVSRQGHGGASMPTLDKSHVWESLAVDIEPSDFVEAILQVISPSALCLSSPEAHY